MPEYLHKVQTVKLSKTSFLLGLILVMSLSGCNLATNNVVPEPTTTPVSAVPLPTSAVPVSANDPFGAEAVENAPFPSLSYGIQTFTWWDTGYAGLHLDWVRLLSFGYVKQMFPWQDLEPNPGQWNFAQADRVVEEVLRRDLKLVVRLGNTPDWALPASVDPTNTDIHDTPAGNYEQWANYCRTVAERYAGRVTAYQIWNEPNLSREWGGQEPDAAAFTQYMAACSTAIRQVDPNAILISPGLAPTGTYDQRAHPDDVFLNALYDANFQQFVDVVGVHATGYSHPLYGPDDAERDGVGRWATFRRVEDLRKIMVERGDAQRQMAILEFGWTTDPIHPDYSWFAVDEETQAEYLGMAYEYVIENWRPWVGLMSLIYMPDPNWTEANEEYWWAITTPDKGHRPAFFTLASMPKVCDDYVIPYRAPDSPEATGLVPAPICP